ncbi:cupin domain-containing protein [Beggiatoa alba]|nr:AraC family ligand binding domain-containing protein [Beggiatoa alba]
MHIVNLFKFPASSVIPQVNLLYDESTDIFPSKLYELSGNAKFTVPENSTCFLYQHQGHSVLTGHYNLPVYAGMYACVTAGEIKAMNGQAIIIERLNYRGMFSIGGEVEPLGRLRYIDGCTDSLLVPPVKFGDACLNALFFPVNTHQTPHTHPSVRIGMVIRGHGICATPDHQVPLVVGDIFVIPTDTIHSFHTDANDELVVIAYHPDTDFGAKDEDHPMINRSLVNGVSARFIDEIRTKA